MAIVTISGSPTKGTPVLLTLNKTDLSNHSQVSADSYFSVISNWSSIILLYKSTSSNQQEIVKFNASESTPTAYAYIANEALGDFQIQKLFIKDKQHGSFIIDRADLITNQFDLIYGISSGNNEWDILFNYVTTSGGGQLKNNGDSGQNNWNNVASISSPINGNFTFSGTLKTANNGNNNMMIGYRTSVLSSASSSPDQNIKSGIYITNANQVNSYAGVGSSISSLNYPTFSNNQSYNFEIKRVGSLISFKFNGVLVGEETYSNQIHIVAAIFTTFVNGNTELLSTTIS